MNEMIKEIMKHLKDNGTNSGKKRYLTNNEPEPYDAVPKSIINQLAKKYKNEDIWKELWKTGHLDAQLLAVYLMNPKFLSEEEVTEVLSTENVSLLVWDKFIDKVLSRSKNIDHFVIKLKNSDKLIHQRLRWSLEVHNVKKRVYTNDDVKHLIDEIYRNLKTIPEPVRWVMNRCMVEIAMNYPDFTDAIYQKATQMGVYKEMKVPKGCTSAYGPEWIDALKRNRKL